MRWEEVVEVGEGVGGEGVIVEFEGDSIRVDMGIGLLVFVNVVSMRVEM